MKRYVAAVALLAVASGCGTAGVQLATAAIGTAVDLLSPAEVRQEVAEMDVGVPRVEVPGEVTESVPSGEIDWSGNVVRATGSGVVDPDNPNRAQAILMAERAAVVVAQRNLLETAQGVTIDSETRVENFMTDYDVIYSRVEGVVRNASQVGPAVYDSVTGTVEVELEMEIHDQQGLSGAINAALEAPEGALPMSGETQEFLQQYSALVFDGTGAGLQPSMYPKIYDSEGNLLLDTGAYADYLGTDMQSAVQFVSDLDRILGSSVYAREPFVVQVREAAGALGTDIVLGPAESQALGWLRNGLPFLAEAGRFVLGVL